MQDKRDTAYFKSELWIALSTMEFTDFEGEIVETDIEFSPNVELTAEVEFSSAQLKQLFDKKRNYLEAARGEEVDFEEVLDELAADIAAGADIVFNRVGYDTPSDGCYERVNDTQWKQVEPEDYYSQYRELLWDITRDMEGDGIPSIPGLYRPFLLRVSQSNTHELPPEGAVEDILRTHIESVRSEKNARSGVRKLKQKLESNGVNPRTAASIANDMDEYLKTDAELEDST